MVDHVLVLFLNTASDVSRFREVGISSQIFRASEEKVSLQLYAVFVFFSLYNLHVFLGIRFLNKLEYTAH